jgi:hypothetical protein
MGDMKERSIQFGEVVAGELLRLCWLRRGVIPVRCALPALPGVYS